MAPKISKAPRKDCVLAKRERERAREPSNPKRRRPQRRTTTKELQNSTQICVLTAKMRHETLKQSKRRRSAHEPPSVTEAPYESPKLHKNLRILRNETKRYKARYSNPSANMWQPKVHEEKNNVPKTSKRHKSPPKDSTTTQAFVFTTERKFHTLERSHCKT